MTDKMKKSLDFVVKHYRRDAFKPDTSFIGKPKSPWWRGATGIAAMAGGALLTVAAYTFIETRQEVREPAVVTEQVTEKPKTEAVHVETAHLEFDDAPLDEVVERIENTYNVRIIDLPSDRSQRLTLSFEGNVEELVDAINEVLSTDMKVEEK